MKISLKKILVLAAALLGVAAFFMMFVNGIKETITTVLLGNTKVSVEYVSGIEALFGIKNDGGDVIVKGATGAFIGYLLALVGGAAAVVSALVIKDQKIAKLVVIGAAALLVVAAVLMFLETTMWMSINELENGGAGIGGLVSGTVEYGLGAGPIVGGILAVVGAGAAGASVVVKK